MQNYFTSLKVATSGLFSLSSSSLTTTASIGSFTLSNIANVAKVPIIGEMASGAAHVVTMIEEARRLNTFETIVEILDKEGEWLATQLALHITISYQWIIESLPSISEEDLRALKVVLSACLGAAKSRDGKKLSEEMRAILNKLLKRKPPTPAKLFADFIVAKLKTIIEQINISTYSQLATNLMDALVTESSGFEWLIQSICDLLKFDQVVGQETLFHAIEKKWLFSHLCTDLAIVDAEGNYYVSPKHTDLECYGYRYGSQAEALRLGFKPAIFNTEKIRLFPSIRDYFVSLFGDELQTLSPEATDQLFKFFLTPGYWLDSRRVEPRFRDRLDRALGAVDSRANDEKNTQTKQLNSSSAPTSEITPPAIYYSAPISQNHRFRSRSTPSNRVLKRETDDEDVAKVTEEKILDRRYNA